MPEVLVIGGGAGAFAAACLARHGFRVTLVERSPGLLTGASGRNGRRLHLGEHYSADVLPADDETSVNTGRLCFLGAIALAEAFPGVVSRNPQWWQLIPTGSMTNADRYEEHLAGLRTFQRALARLHPRVDELFGPAHARHRRLDPREYGRFVSVEAAAGYASPESVIDLAYLRRGLLRALTAAPVRIVVNTEVIALRAQGSGYEATLRHVRSGDSGARCYDCVINATWHEIPTLSRMVSADHDDAATTRLKLIVTAAVPPALASLPSLYFHRGVYGNHTNVAGRYAIVTAEHVSNLSFARLGAVPETWQPLLADRVRTAPGRDQWLALTRLTEGDPSAGSTGSGRTGYVVRQAVCHARTAPGGPRARSARRWLGREVLRAYSHLVPARSARWNLLPFGSAPWSRAATRTWPIRRARFTCGVSRCAKSLRTSSTWIQEN